MSRVILHPKPLLLGTPTAPLNNPLPALLQTPSGLALLEMQGTINMPSPSTAPDAGCSMSLCPATGVVVRETPIGRVVFPDWDAAAAAAAAAADDGGKWMKRVYLYVGKHQRLTGEVRKLPKPLAVIRRRVGAEEGPQKMAMAVDGREEAARDGEERTEQLEVVEIVKFKILFSIRPEPVGTCDAADGL